MDFGDDPLADLSDGSNDSFFEVPKTSTKRSSLTKTPEKKSLTDLFNISSDKHQEIITPVTKKSDDWLGLDSKDSLSEIRKSPARTPKLARKITFDDDDDILGTLGISKRPQSKSEADEGKTKKVDLLESILGPSKSSEDVNKKPTFDGILKEAKTTPVRPPSGDSFPLGDAPREGRRGRRSSTGLMDPLGLFTPVKDEPDATIKTPSARVEEVAKPTHSKSTPNIPEQAGLPDWLGGSAVKQSKSENVLGKKPEPPKEAEVEAPVPSDDSTQVTTLDTILTQQKLAQSHVDYQNTAIALQQQESQLLVALQLKKYEENMSEMQNKQQEILMKQEQQFNTLLERQFAKQQIMENNMRLQQERINRHIEMLIAQPPVTKYGTQGEREELKKSESEENVKVYENIINSLKQRQQEEIFLLEESYRKQISLLEKSLESVETRLKTDVDKMSEVLEEKVKRIQTQHEEEIDKYKRKIQDVETQHLDEIKQIREHSVRMIDEIKYEHSTLLDNIKQAKQSETSLFSESTLYIQKLDKNADILYSASKSLQDLRSQVESDYGVLSQAREETIKAKEHEISMMKATLEKCRESAERERAELLGLVRSLETKIAEQNQNAREERWAFQQAASTLAARSAAMDREAEFNRASIEREREQLKTLKESLLAEQDKLILQMTEEKLALSAEKARLETSNRLMANYDTQKAKAEVDAAVQMAKEAAELTDRERESLQREKCEVEKLKRSLLDRERKLSLREAEVEELTREAGRRIGEGERAISESKTMENTYNERLRELQKQLVNLANREKKLAEEKISLAKERLTLNTMIRQNKKCGLCAADSQKYNEDSPQSLNVITPYFPRFANVDSDIIRLRMEALEDEPTSALICDDNVPK